MYNALIACNGQLSFEMNFIIYKQLSQNIIEIFKPLKVLEIIPFYDNWGHMK